MRSDKQCIELAKKWADNPYFDLSDREQLKEDLVSNPKKVAESFYMDLEFGTAGIRSIVGFGPNRLSIYNIRKAAFSLGSVVKNEGGSKVVISYDSRLTSLEYANASAKVFSALGFDVFLVSKPTPTPVLSFFVRELKCDCGVMITASHNPPNYNGFKAYWSDGAQITPPNDSKIINKFKATSWEDLEKLVTQKEKIQYIEDKFYDTYIERITNEHLRKDLIQKKGNELKIIYTPLHGVGYECMKKSFDALGFNSVDYLESQRDPNGNFPTTMYPNPEDPEALELAVKAMQDQGADLVIGADPDADRMGIALNDNGVSYPTGNQIAYATLYYKLLTLKEFSKIPQKPFAVKTIVTSPLQEKICSHFNVKLIDTLTGFKWIGAAMETRDDSNYIYGSEEAFGSLTHKYIRDKDGISAACVFSEMLLFCKSKNMSFHDFLQEIYKMFGYHYEKLVSSTYPGKEGLGKIKRIMTSLRGEGAHEISDLDLLEIRDYEGLFVYDLKSKKKSQLDFPQKSNVLTFVYKEGVSVHVRPSGTEPKIKFYLQYAEDSFDKDSKMRANLILEKLEKTIRSYCDEI